MGAKTVSDNFSDFARLGMIVVSYFCRFWYVVIVVGLPQTRQRGAQRVSFNHQISEIIALFGSWPHHSVCWGLPGGGVWVTRGGVYQRWEVVVSSVGVSVAPAVPGHVVVELLHPQSATSASVGACNGNISEHDTNLPARAGVGTIDFTSCSGLQYFNNNLVISNNGPEFASICLVIELSCSWN